MAIRKVARMGHPVLRKRARELTAEEIRSPALRNLVQDMLETMHEYGGIGLAAPQIHESVRLALLEVDPANERYEDLQGQPLLVLVNPKVTVLDPEPQGFWEGCLSVPELRGLVFRPRKIQVDYVDLDARPRQFVAEDFLATVFQHELDHLDGMLYVDRIVADADGRLPLAFIEEYQRYLVPAKDSEHGELED